MKVRLTATAESDLEQIGDRNAEADPERAWLTIRALKAAVRSIGALPYVSSPVASTPAVRKKAVRPYVLLFSVRDGEVLILRIAHERSDWISLI